MVSIPGCSSRPLPSPTVSEPWLFRQIHWENSRHALLRAMTFLDLKQRSWGCIRLQMCRYQPTLSSPLKTGARARPPVPAAARAGCRSSLAAGCCWQSLPVYRRFTPSLPAPCRSVDFSHVCKVGAATPGLRGATWGNGVRFGTPLLAIPCSGSSTEMPARLRELWVLHGFSHL